MDADPGLPKIIWAGYRSIRVLGQYAMLNGFRFGGTASLAGGPVKKLQGPDKSYEFDSDLTGCSPPALGTLDQDVWIAVFAVSTKDSDYASLRFIPFLRVTEYDPSSGIAKIRRSAGKLKPQFFAGAHAQIPSEKGWFTNRVVQIKGNTEDTITLSTGLNLDRDDYILPAPGRNIDFKYLASLKLDYSPSVPGGAEWRNFTHGSGLCHSATGNPFGAITAHAPPMTELSFNHHIAPLATGVVVIGQATTTSARGDGAYLYLCHDSSVTRDELPAHYVASFGIDRSHQSQMGTSSNAVITFGARQSLWAMTSATDVVGNVDIRGWLEG